MDAAFAASPLLGLSLAPDDRASSSGALPLPHAGAPQGMSPEAARGVAHDVHRGQIEPSGGAYIDHVRRVADGVPAEAVTVAWLHDALERSDVSEQDLMSMGLAPHERAALRLLTHNDDAGERDDVSFLAHVRVIAATPGPAGPIARAVKRADMEDRMRLPRDPQATWRPPYRRALELLAPEAGDRPADIPDDPQGGSK